MNRIAVAMHVLNLSLAVAVPARAAEPNPQAAKAVAEIEKLGGRVTIDENSPDKPVIGVDLEHTRVTDAGLEHLKGLTKLQTLDLQGTSVTDAGLEHLKGLVRLKELDLSRSKVTAEGVKRLRQRLPNCEIMWEPRSDDK